MSDETLIGDSENDTLTGGAGNDTLSGLAGDDYLDGGDGQDQLLGGTGDDTLDASGGSASTQGLGDYVRPGLGNNVIIGHEAYYNTGQGVDLSYADITGLPGLLIVSGANGSGMVTGAGGQVNDTFSFVHYFEGSQGNDTIIGSDENRFEGFAGLGGADSIVGGGGFNVLDYSFEASYFGGGTGIVADMDAGPGGTGLITDTQGNVDTVSGIGELRGTAENDNLNAEGTSQGIVLRGLAGDDTIVGSSGSDLIEGGAGADSINPGDNTNFDQISTGTGNDTVNLADVSTGFIDVRHSGLTGPITATVNGNANTATIDKGADGTTTILSVANAMDAGTGDGAGGFSVTGTTFGDVFNVTGRDGGWVGLDGGAGQDSYNFSASTGGTLRLGFSSAVEFGVSVNLTTGIVGNDGFGNAETITGAANVTELLGTQRADSVVGSAGDDKFILLSGNDTVDGAGGVDLLRYDWAGIASVNANLTTQVATGTSINGAFTQDISNIENLIGSRSGNDSLTGTNTANDLNGLGGNDSIFAGDGNDAVTGGSGADLLYGGNGDDTITGGDDFDWITGGAGNDSMDGGAANDMVSFIESAQRVIIDMVAGTAVSGAETDTFVNFEQVTASIYNDFIIGDENDNRFRALGDYDWIIGSGGTDTYEGGAGRDMVSYIYSTEGVGVNLAAGLGTAGLALGDRYDSIERVTGSSYADVFVGGPDQDDFRGLAGNDIFFSSVGGRERYDGGSGVDLVSYGASLGGVSASLSLGRGSSGDALRDLYTSIENLTGSNFDDFLYGDAFANTMNGQGGDDFLFGEAGQDNLRGGSGNDYIDGGAGYDYAFFSSRSQDYEITTENGITTVSGGLDGVDTILNVEVLIFTNQYYFL